MKSVRLEGNRLEAVAGHLDDTFRLIEATFGVRISARGTEAQVTGTGDDAAEKEGVLSPISWRSWGTSGEGHGGPER